MSLNVVARSGLLGREFRCSCLGCDPASSHGTFEGPGSS